MKKILATFIIFYISLIQIVNSSENEIYKKIDLFGEVLEKIKFYEL